LGGLEALCAGLAVAALVVATVATGGLALAAAAVAVGACGVGIGAGITALVTMNMCNSCLLQWQMTHNHVSIQGAQALLQSFFLTCSKGGVITIVLDPFVALEAAEKISNDNNNEVLWQMGKEFSAGIITVASTGIEKFGGGPVGLIVASVLAPIDFCRTENIKENERANQLINAFKPEGVPTAQQNSTNEQIEEDIKDFRKHDLKPTLGASAADAATLTTTMTTTSATSATMSEAAVVSGDGLTVASASKLSVASVTKTTITAETALTKMETTVTEEYVSKTAVSASKATVIMTSDATSDGIAAVASKSISMSSEESLEIATKAGFSGSDFATSMGVGLAGAAANIGIGIAIGNEQDALYKKTVDYQYGLWKQNSLNADAKMIADRK